jgi:hypothetical protein
MQFTRTRRPVALQSLRSATPTPPVATARVATRPRSPEWRELAGACALIAVFLVMAMFG